MYERNNMTNNKNINRQPTYYNEYIVDEQENNKGSYLWFVIFISVFVFLPSMLDIVFSYIEIDVCQNIEHISTLNIFLRYMGISSILYYIFVFLYVYFLYIRNRNENYTRMNNRYEIIDRETNNNFFKIFITIFTMFILIIQIFITYLYFSYFNHYCTSYTIIIYMWLRLLIGILSSIFIIFSVFFIKIE
jgi:hypothetical protein